MVIPADLFLPIGLIFVLIGAIGMARDFDNRK